MAKKAKNNAANERSDDVDEAPAPSEALVKDLAKLQNVREENGRLKNDLAEVQSDLEDALESVQSLQGEVARLKASTGLTDREVVILGRWDAEVAFKSNLDGRTKIVLRGARGHKHKRVFDDFAGLVAYLKDAQG